MIRSIIFAQPLSTIFSQAASLCMRCNRRQISTNLFSFEIKCIQNDKDPLCSSFSLHKLWIQIFEPTIRCHLQRPSRNRTNLQYRWKCFPGVACSADTGVQNKVWCITMRSLQVDTLEAIYLILLHLWLWSPFFSPQKQQAMYLKNWTTKTLLVLWKYGTPSVPPIPQPQPFCMFYSRSSYKPAHTVHEIWNVCLTIFKVL